MERKVALSLLILSALALTADCTADGHKNRTSDSFLSSKSEVGIAKGAKSQSHSTSELGCRNNCDNKSVKWYKEKADKYTTHRQKTKLRTDSSDSFVRAIRQSSKSCSRQTVKSFYCQRIKFYTWLSRALREQSTALNTFIELKKRGDESEFAKRGLEPVLDGQVPWIESLFSKWGQPADMMAFRALKTYLLSSELKVSLPFKGTYVALAPKTYESEQETGRIFFDPGFNLKMKLPFFRDELKFAVSTGPSFIAGLGVGMVVLGMKALMSPLMIGMKAMLLSMFMGDSSPWDLMKSFLGYSTDEATEEQHQVDVYNPPPTNNHYEYLLGKHQGGHKHMLPSGPSGYDGGQGGNDHHAGGYSEQAPVQHAFAGRVNPILPILVQNLPTALSAPSGLSGLKQQASSLAQTWLTGNSGLTGTLGNLMQLQELQNRKQAYRTLVTAPAPTPSAPPSGGGNDGNSQSSTSDRGKKSEPEESGFKYVPATALHLDVENFDPFYSPLLSRIDSIFMHLGFNEEGCKERAVCSIYKSPVKYAPYSNLLSAQLSKHQSELKKPVNTSPKILRYFKYMKAAKDGQSALNCVDLYPQCANDTDKLTNLPMVKTFQQLTELLSSGPGNTG